MEELQPEEIKDLLKELEEDHGREEAPRREARDDALQRLEEAYAAEDRDEFGPALLKCDLAIQLNPGLAEAHNLRGIVLEELGRRREAAAAYREAIRLDPGSAEAEENLHELEAELKVRDRLRHYEKVHTRKEPKVGGWIYAFIPFGIVWVVVSGMAQRPISGTSGASPLWPCRV